MVEVYSRKINEKLMVVGCLFASLYLTAEFLLIVRGYEMWTVFQLEIRKSPETLERNATVE